MLRLGREASEERVTVMLRPRKQPAREVDLVGVRHADDPAGHLRWVIVPRDLLRSRLPTAALPDDPPAEAADAPAGDDDLVTAAAIARLYTLPLDEHEQQHWFTQLAVAIRSAVPAADAVSLTLGSPSAPERVASDSAEAQHVDGLQFRLGEGPCVEGYEREVLVLVPDLRHDPRWPRLAAAAQDERVRSVLAVPVRVNDQRAGVVNLYAFVPGAFDQRTARVVEIVAAALAAVLEATGERASLRALVQHMERALDSRATIEQAKGVIMAHHGGTPDEAFARLVAYSSRHNVKLRDLASLIVEGGGRGAVRGM
jgi:hypothetical protein